MRRLSQMCPLHRFHLSVLPELGPSLKLLQRWREEQNGLLSWSCGERSRPCGGLTSRRWCVLPSASSLFRADGTGPQKWNDRQRSFWRIPSSRLCGIGALSPADSRLITLTSPRM
ncbi:Cilia- And Flagella-Associated Protein 54 [Manis pentadactyla]|nr:Cilia- And Flagella-Associated Protein 54 [Manis pentadactyla]